jgi:hypothetical protein
VNTSEGLTSGGASIPNGSGAGAVLSAGIGCFSLSVLTFAGDKLVDVKNALIFYKPTGALSGVTTTAILVWLVTWAVLEWRWRNKNLPLRRIGAVALTLLGLSLLLTFPPVVDFF